LGEGGEGGRRWKLLATDAGGRVATAGRKEEGGGSWRRGVTYGVAGDEDLELVRGEEKERLEMLFLLFSAWDEGDQGSWLFDGVEGAGVRG